MEPTLSPGDRVLMNPQSTVKNGDVVVVRHPTDPSLLVVKRIGRILGKSQVELVSDNPDEGTDSRTWGPVDIDLIVGVVTLQVERAFEVDSPSNFATRLRR